MLEQIAGEDTEKDYLSQHIANVCVLSLAIGMQMNFNKSKLHILGMAAVFHDIGMLDCEAIVEKPQELSEDEYEEVKNHVLKGGEIVSKIGGFSI